MDLGTDKTEISIRRFFKRLNWVCIEGQQMGDIEGSLALLILKRIQDYLEK